MRAEQETLNVQKAAKIMLIFGESAKEKCFRTRFKKRGSGSSLYT